MVRAIVANEHRKIIHKVSDIPLTRASSSLSAACSVKLNRLDLTTHSAGISFTLLGFQLRGKLGVLIPADYFGSAASFMV
jgi:hypothetical protein